MEFQEKCLEDVIFYNIKVWNNVKLVPAFKSNQIVFQTMGSVDRVLNYF